MTTKLNAGQEEALTVCLHDLLMLSVVLRSKPLLAEVARRVAVALCEVVLELPEEDSRRYLDAAGNKVIDECATTEARPTIQ